jgi:hypothetical protein
VAKKKHLKISIRYIIKHLTASRSHLIVDFHHSAPDSSARLQHHARNLIPLRTATPVPAQGRPCKSNSQQHGQHPRIRTAYRYIAPSSHCAPSKPRVRAPAAGGLDAAFGIWGVGWCFIPSLQSGLLYALLTDGIVRRSFGNSKYCSASFLGTCKPPRCRVSLSLSLLLAYSPSSLLRLGNALVRPITLKVAPVTARTE